MTLDIATAIILTLAGLVIYVLIYRKIKLVGDIFFLGLGGLTIMFAGGTDPYGIIILLSAIASFLIDIFT